MKLAQRDAEMATRNRADFLREVDPSNRLTKLDLEIVSRRQAAQERGAAYAAVVADIEAALGVDLKLYSYDDVTGRLFPQGTTPDKGN